MKIPSQLLMLDAFGALLLGLGLAELLAGTNLVPEPFRFDGYPVAMIVLGIALMAPLLLHVIKTATSKETTA